MSDINIDHLRELQEALIDHATDLLSTAELGAKVAEHRETLEVLIADRLKNADCPDCGGKGFVSCGQCGGRGYRGYESDPSYCNFCRRTGKIACVFCLDRR